MIALCAVLAAGVLPSSASVDANWQKTHIRRALVAGLPDAQLGMLARAGVNVLQVDLWGYATEGMANKALGAELDRFLVHAHRLGIKVTLYVHTRSTARLKDHPEWAVLDPAGKPKNGAVYVCQNSPGGQALIDEMVRFVKRHSADGLWLDCWTNDIQNCWCPACREMFTKETGLEMPAAADLADIKFCKYVEWRDRAAAGFFKRMHDAVKAARPDVRIWVNFSAGIMPSTLPHSDSVFRMVDGPAFEMWMPRQMDISLNNPFSVSRLYGLAGGRDSEVWMLPTAHGYGDWTAIPDVELLSRVFTCLTYGPTVQLPAWPGHDEQLATVFHAIKAREKYVIGAKPLKWAALLTSYRSAEFYGRGDAMTKYWEEMQGAWRALTEEHVPVEFVTEQDIADGRLSDYKVAVIPNGACLSEEVLAAVRRFVDGGGGLVATHETSLYDMYGAKRPDFALADMLRAHYVGEEKTPEFQGDRIWFGGTSITRDPIITRSVMTGHTVWGGVPGSVDWLGRSLNVTAASGGIVAVKRSSAGKKDPKLPALILSNAGKGRVAFFPLEVGSSYYNSSYAYLRRLLVNATLWAAREEPPVMVRGPLCLAATYRVQNVGKSVIVHLLNDLGGTGRRARDAAVGYSLLREIDYMPIREEVIPLHDVKVSCLLSGVKSAHLEPEGTPLKLMKRKGGVEVTVPRLKLHSMVVFERRSCQ